MLTLKNKSPAFAKAASLLWGACLHKKATNLEKLDVIMKTTLINNKEKIMKITEPNNKINLSFRTTINGDGGFDVMVKRISVNPAGGSIYLGKYDLNEAMENQSDYTNEIVEIVRFFRENGEIDLELDPDKHTGEYMPYLVDMYDSKFYLFNAKKRQVCDHNVSHEGIYFFYVSHLIHIPDDTLFGIASR